MKIFIDNRIHAQWQISDWLRGSSTTIHGSLRLGLGILASVGAGLAVIVSTYYVDNVKLLFGLIGGLVFVIMTMRWPEFGIISLVALLSGLISLSWMALLHLGPISINIPDMILILLMGLVFLRATTQRGFVLHASPLLPPLLFFFGAILIAAVNGILIFNVGFNQVFRTVRVLGLWLLLIPMIQLIRDERALRRLILGLLILSAVLILGVLFPNRFEPILPVEETAASTGGQVYSGFTRVYFSGDMVLYAMIPVTFASLALVKKGNQLWRLALLGFLLFWLFKTFFRQYWLTQVVICLLLLLFFSRWERMNLLRRMLPAVLVCAVIFAIILASQPTLVEKIVYVVTDRLGSLLNNPVRSEGSLQWRAIETRYALLQIYRHPIFGLGLGNSYRPQMEAEPASMYSGWASRYVENGYLYILVMMGLVGLVPFLWLCGAYLLRVVRHYREIKDDDFRAVYLGLGAAFLGMMACNIATPTFVFGSRLIFFPLAMGISEVILRLEREKSARPENPTSGSY